MSSKIKKILAACSLFLFLGANTPPRNEVDKNMLLMKVLMYALQNHYDTKPIDDEFSKNAFMLYINDLDPSKRFLTQDDVDKMRKHQYMIDNEANEGTYQFFDMSAKIIEKRIQETQTYYKGILAKPFDFEKDEQIPTDAEDLAFAKNQKELKEYWRKYLKYSTLTRLSDLVAQQKIYETEAEKGDEKAKEKLKTYAELEAEARNGVLKSHEEWFEYMTSRDVRDWRSSYLNAITSTYDPHTNYFAPKDKENFDIQMSGKLEGIGAVLQTQDGYIKIMRIVPGSACWKQGDLEVGDKILKVAQGDAEPVDVVGMRQDDAVRLIRGDKGTEVRLTVRKKDESVLVIPIIRDVVEIEQTYAKSAILKKKDGKTKVGYLNLPRFYTDFKKGGRNSADDVKTELDKLNQENIEGLVLDLRNNGGGSLADVVKMAGYFIKEGPVVQVKSRDGKPDIHQDTDKNIYFDKPLVILVNSYSASASEILAAAMQDYGRAVVIGGASTFGKGTVQRLIDLDGFVMPAYQQVKPLGTMKLTLQKFYRINGGATQLKGVTPDIILPDAYSKLDIGEKEHDYAMTWDEIESLQYEPFKKAPKFDKLRAKSAKRVENSPVFELITENAQRLKKQRDRKYYTLNLQKHQAEMEQLKEENKKYSDINAKTPELASMILKMDKTEFKADSMKMVQRESWLKTLQKDIYLYESVSVLEDMN